MRISTGVQTCALPICAEGQPDLSTEQIITVLLGWMDEDSKATPLKELQGRIWRQGYEADRKSVVKGTRVSVRVDLGGRGIIKKKCVTLVVIRLTTSRTIT